MSDFQGTLNKTLQAFIKQVTTIANRAAIATLESAFNPQGGGFERLRTSRHETNSDGACGCVGACRLVYSGTSRSTD